MTSWTLTIPSPIGELRAFAGEDGLQALLVTEGDPAKHGVPGPVEEGADQPTLRALAKQLGEYFAGRRRAFDLPLAPIGTDFQRQAWKALLDIPYGETRSYAQQAAAIGRPKAVRAIGAANGRNPIAIVVPCHRVIGSGGELTGYAGGLPIKRALLELEGCLPRTEAPLLPIRG